MAQVLISASDLLSLLQTGTALVLLCCGEVTEPQPLQVMLFPIDAEELGWEKYMDALGDLVLPGEDTLIVCYEQNGVHTAAQAWWGLKYVGRTRVAVLEGGSEAVRLASLSLPPWKPGPQLTSTQGHLMKTEFEAKLLVNMPGWECQIISTDSQLGYGLQFDPQLVLTSLGRVEEPIFLREILFAAGVNLSELCQSIVFGSKACTLLLALSLLGKQNTCLGLKSTVSSPRGEIEMVSSTEFHTAVGEEDEFFDALGDSRRPSYAAPTIQPHTSLKKMQPNAASRPTILESKADRSCQCSLM